MRCFRPCTAAVRTSVALTLLAGLPALAADLPGASSPNPLLTTGNRQTPVLTQPLGTVLPADQAFVLSVLPEANHDIVLVWDIHSGHYLYQDSLKISTGDGRLLTPSLPAAAETSDEFFGTVAVYYERLQLRLPASATGAAAGSSIELLLGYQGCAKDLYCYPPQQRSVTLSFPD
jgi:thiol:disulfide interchange protein